MHITESLKTGLQHAFDGLQLDESWALQLRAGVPTRRHTFGEIAHALGMTSAREAQELVTTAQLKLRVHLKGNVVLN